MTAFEEADEEAGAAVVLARTGGHVLVEQLAVPVTVDDRLWGVLTASSRTGPLPAATEDRLAVFAEIVAAAVVSLEAHRRARLLADEQAALRRVAELVARGAALPEVFDAVASEASRILGDVVTDLFRFDDGFATVVAARSRVSVGASTPVDEDTAIGRLRRAGGPLRLSTMAGTARETEARELGIEVVVGVPVTVEGEVWGALVSSTSGDPLPAGTEDRLAAQQRLVQTVLTLKLGLDAAARGEETTALVREALEHAERATLELRDIVHGILPAALSRGGLRAGIDSLVAPLLLPVDVETAGLPPGRLPSKIGVNAYFVVAEALTNMVNHARASRARVVVGVVEDRLVVEVGDDGVGGADPRRGSGLTGLSDRVDVLEGTLSVTSPVGVGTTVRVTLPLPGC